MVSLDIDCMHLSGTVVCMPGGCIDRKIKIMILISESERRGGRRAVERTGEIYNYSECCGELTT